MALQQQEHNDGKWQILFFPVSVFILFCLYLAINYLPSDSHHAGVPPTKLDLPVIPASASGYTAALKEYKDKDKTDSEGDGLSW